MSFVRRNSLETWRTMAVVAWGLVAPLVTGCTISAAAQPPAATAASFSNTICAAAGATAGQVFRVPGTAAGGTADATGIIQRDINAAAAAGGGIVSVPAGVFVINGHLRLRTGVALTGAGPATVLKAGPRFLDTTGPAPYGGYPLITTAGARNATIANLTADQSGDTLNANTSGQARLSAYLIDVRSSSNVVVSDVYTRNPFSYSIAVVGSSDFCVARCDTRVATSGRYDSLDGIHVLDSHTGQVIGNHVDQRVGTDGDDGLVAHTMHAAVYDVLYADNTVRGGNNGDGMQLAVGKYPIDDVIIRDNDFWGSPFGIRTGYWGTGPGGTVRHVYIAGNHIHDLVPGKAFPRGGDAINIGGFGAVGPVEYVTVTANVICHAGTITVTRGRGNVVHRNHFC
jgi:polygalacturonase